MNTLLINKLEELTPRSAWLKGVKAYALELVEGAEVELTRDNALKELLNGAYNWYVYSYNGNAYVYDVEIVEALCTPSEIRRFKDGKLNKPNGQETWLDLQGRALNHAYHLIRSRL